MRRGAAILIGAILVGCLAAAAAARSVSVVQLPLNGAVFLSGSNVRCGSGKSVKQVTLVDCEIVESNGYPKPGGYTVLMEANGRVNVTANATLKTVFDRTPAGARRVAGKVVLHKGDTIQLPGTPQISCNATLVTGKPNVFCYYVDKTGVVRPHSYSFAISDSFVTVLGWNAKRHASALGTWRENG